MDKDNTDESMREDTKNVKIVVHTHTLPVPKKLVTKIS